MLTFAPQYRAPLEYARAGDTLLIGGNAFDFTALPEGATLPRTAVGSDLVVSDVTRIDGALHMTLIKSVDINGAGDDPVIADGIPKGAPAGESDWSQMVTPESKDEAARAALHAAIDAERARRIGAGRAFLVPGLEVGIPLQGRIQDQTAYLALLGRAQAMQGVDGANMTIRAGDDTIHSLTPEQMVALIAQGMGWFEQVMVVSWAMKDGTGAFSEGVPDDFADDKWWP